MGTFTLMRDEFRDVCHVILLWMLYYNENKIKICIIDF